MKTVIVAIAGLIVLALSVIFLSVNQATPDLSDVEIEERSMNEVEQTADAENSSSEPVATTPPTAESGEVVSNTPETAEQEISPRTSEAVEMPQTIQSGREMIDTAYVLYYNASGPEEFLSAIAHFQAVISGMDVLIERGPNNDGAFYTRSLAQYELGEMHFFDIPDWNIEADHDATREYLEAAWESAKSALKLNRDVSEHHRIVGQAVNRLIPFMDQSFAITYGGIPQQEGRLALDLDPSNARAYMVIGQSFLFTPEAFGGDLEKAIEAFHDALSTAQNTHEEFMSNTWLGWALSVAEDVDGARSHLESALEIYPNSDWANSLLSQL